MNKSVYFSQPKEIMRIDSTNCIQNKQYNYSKQPSFKKMVLYRLKPEFKPIEKELLDEIVLFHKTKSNAKFLGQGLFSKVYEFIKFPNIVIKDAVLNCDNFKQEEEGLINTPETLTTSQHYVTTAFEDQEYKYYLLSTKVDGDSANPQTNPWTSRNLKNLFDGMFEMDKKGFYHGDLNNGNIKIDKKANVNFLDYQWATQREPHMMGYIYNSRECLPGFIPTMNSQMFEMASIPHYIKLLSKNKYTPMYFIKDYLAEKSNYHFNRANFFGQNTTTEKIYSQYEHKNFRKALIFERAQSFVLKNPSDEVIKLETKKFQFLSSFREAYRFTDPNIKDKNVLTAPSAYLVALSDVQLFLKEVRKQKQEVESNTFLDDYLDGMQDYGNYWEIQLENWASDAFKFTIYEIERDNYEYWYKINTKPDYFKPISNFVNLIKEDYQPEYTCNFQIKNSERDNCLENIRNNVRIPRTPYKPLTEKQSMACYETVKVFDKLVDAYNNDKALTALNQALLLARKTIDTSKVFDYNDDRRNVLYELQKGAINFAKNLFEQLHNDIRSACNIDESFYGYENMNEY